MNSPDDQTEYPVVAQRAMEKIIASNYSKEGILICGTGIGMAITANKFPGIYAAVCHDNYSAERARLSNNSNVLCMGARIIGPELAKKVLREWLSLEFQGRPFSFQGAEDRRHRAGELRQGAGGEGMMSRKLHIGTNLKMYKTIRETVSYLTDLQRLVADLADELVLFVIPSYTALPGASAAVDQTRIRLGAQNMHWEEKGQFTGEISPLMLRELNLQIVEIGHSERRHVFGETDMEENKKVISAIRHGFTALLCVGETAEEKEFDIGDERIRQQLKIGLRGLDAAECEQLWIAYEPVWAIGVNGIPATADYAETKHRLIRETLLQLFPQEGGESAHSLRRKRQPTERVRAHCAAGDGRPFYRALRLGGLGL